MRTKGLDVNGYGDMYLGSYTLTKVIALRVYNAVTVPPCFETMDTVIKLGLT